MSLFDSLVAEALKAQRELAPLRIVVEKELLHHDILREMSSAGLLAGLTFIGGTCLRACYGANRLSEDLDFTGGDDFDRETLASLGRVLVERLRVKYGLKVAVSEPLRKTGNVDTWKLKIITHPRQGGMPVQRIHIDICAIPSYDRQPILLRNHYGVEMGTSGLIIQVQSREEILADKIVAFALRPNRLKNRDLWDIAWLSQQNVGLPLDLVAKKVIDHRYTTGEFLELMEARRRRLRDDPQIRTDFVGEMRRFLPPTIISATVENGDFWRYLAGLIQVECDRVIGALTNTRNGDVFAM